MQKTDRFRAMMDQAIANNTVQNVALDVPTSAIAAAPATDAVPGKKCKRSEEVATEIKGGTSKGASGSSVPTSVTRVVPSITAHGSNIPNDQDYKEVTIWRPKSYLARSEAARFKDNETMMTAWASKVDIDSRVAKGTWNVDNIGDLTTMTLIAAHATKKVLATESAKKDEFRKRLVAVDEERKSYIKQLHREKEILVSLRQEIMVYSKDGEDLRVKLAAAEDEEKKTRKDLEDLGSEMMTIYYKAKACLRGAALEAYSQITAPSCKDRTPEAFATTLDLCIKQMEWQAQPSQPIQPE